MQASNLLFTLTTSPSRADCLAPKPFKIKIVHVNLSAAPGWGHLVWCIISKSKGGTLKFSKRFTPYSLHIGGRGARSHKIYHRMLHLKRHTMAEEELGNFRKSHFGTKMEEEDRNWQSRSGVTPGKFWQRKRRSGFQIGKSF